MHGCINASQHSKHVMFKTELVVVALCSTVSPGDQSRKRQVRSEALRFVSLLYHPQSQNHLQKSSTRLNLKLNMDKSAKSWSQMMISSKCMKQTKKKNTHTQGYSLQAGVSEQPVSRQLIE